MRRAALLLLAGCASAPDSVDGIELVRVEGAGLRPFRISRRPVSWAEFDLFYEHPEDEKVDGVTRPSAGKNYLVLSGVPQELLRPDRPVTNVRRHSALAYCEWLTRRTGRLFRLPTERELACVPSSGSEHALEPRTAPAEWVEADPSRPVSTWWYRGGSGQGFRVVCGGPYAPPDVEIAVLKSREHSVRTGSVTERFTRVTGEVRNRGARPIEELGVKVYALDPSGRPHLADTQAFSSRRATFEVCWPVLPHGAPLPPGGVRAFEADVPLSFDDAEAVSPRFGASLLGR